ERLVDDADPKFLSVSWIADFDRPALDDDAARIARVGTAENFHQSGLARAIFAQQNVDFSPTHVEIDSIQRLNTGEALRNPEYFEHHAPGDISRLHDIWMLQNHRPTSLFPAPPRVPGAFESAPWR